MHKPYFIVFLLGFWLASVANAGVRVVSDIDDTAKVTNVSSTFPMLYNGLFSNRPFTGMRELYASMSIERGYAFEYVTGAPGIIKFRAKDFLRDGGFPEGELHTKGTLKGESIREYKVRVLREILAAHPDDQLLLVGDDTQADFDVYDDIFRYAPDRILAIYIRKVTNRKLPPSAYPFLTAFDIARTEFLMGRLTVEQAAPVALAILSERRMNRVVPKFSYCPIGAYFTMEAHIEKWNQDIDARVQKICRARRLPSES